MAQKVLVVAAHPDDELLGEGATIRRLVDEGAVAHALILAEGATSRAGSREEADRSELAVLKDDARRAAQIIGFEEVAFCGYPDNRMDSVDLLDVVKEVSACIDAFKPDTIFTHHHGDLNVDHRVACEAVLTATRPMEDCFVKKIYAFETPSSSEWEFGVLGAFVPNVFVDVTTTLQAKIDGMACYEGESRPSPHPRSSEALRALAEYRGSIAGCRYAEAFQLLRELV